MPVRSCATYPQWIQKCVSEVLDGNATQVIFGKQNKTKKGKRDQWKLQIQMS